MSTLQAERDLLTACRLGSLERCRDILKCHPALVDLNKVRDSLDRTPLHLASE